MRVTRWRGWSRKAAMVSNTQGKHRSDREVPRVSWSMEIDWGWGRYVTLLNLFRVLSVPVGVM